jgi:hypothetical protein
MNEEGVALDTSRCAMIIHYPLQNASTVTMCAAVTAALGG